MTALLLLSARVHTINEVRSMTPYILAAIFAALWLIAIADWGSTRPPRPRRWEESRRRQR